MKWVKKIRKMFGNAEKVNNNQVIVRTDGEIDFQITRIKKKFYIKMIDVEPELEVKNINDLTTAAEVLLYLFYGDYYG